MEVIFVLTLLFIFLVIVGSLVLGVVLIWRWFTKPAPTPPHVVQPTQARLPRREDDLAAFERQLVRFYRDGKINDEIYEQLLARVRAERAPKAAMDNTDFTEKVVTEKVAVQSASSV